MAIRPALVPTLGEPPATTVEFFRETLTTLQQEAHENLKKSTRPAQVIYLANGLAEWDAHLTKSLSPSTEAALELMFAIQNENGTWGTLTCWPPLESDAYHEATVAAMAAATAPGWLDNVAASDNAALKEAVERLRSYLRTETPPHDYSRVLLLWAESRWPGLIDEARKAELIAMLRNHQRDDGGWSIRTFATPETWGSGNRAKKLRDEPDFDKPASDGHMTGLAIIALRSSDVPANDPAIAGGVKWLKANQRESGRWWTRSLNTDTWHFITYSGTAYPLLALQMCDELPTVAKK
jgi:squalene-hopene/tetraprenyl-beta-curcumene cyclase